MITAILGFLAPFVPDLCKFVGDWFKAKRDFEQEEKALNLQIKLEATKSAGKVVEIQAYGEIQECLAQIQGDLDAYRLEVSDRKEARERESAIHMRLVEVVSLGKRLNVPQWMMSIGWFIAVLIEAFAAVVTPMIAATIFTMWSTWKCIGFYNAAYMGDDAIRELLLWWTPDDWDILWAVLSYYVGSRIRKRVKEGR